MDYSQGALHEIPRQQAKGSTVLDDLTTGRNWAIFEDRNHTEAKESKTINLAGSRGEGQRGSSIQGTTTHSCKECVGASIYLKFRGKYRHLLSWIETTFTSF